MISVGNVRAGQALAFGHKISLTAVNPPASEIFNLDWKEGSPAVLRSLGEDGAFVDKDYADDHHLAVGSPVPLTFPNGSQELFNVKGIFDPPTGGSPFGRVTISTTVFDRHNSNPENLYSFVIMQGGQTDANKATLDRTLKRFPNAKAATRQKFIDNQISGLSSILNILYVLLALSVIVSLFGIVNTLVLTVFERTREIGMLRAIGMTRRQVRRMIRHESVITALIGAVDRHLARHHPRRASHRARRLHRALGADRTASRVPGRRHHRRDHRGDLPRPPRRAAERARSAAVRVVVSRRTAAATG